MVKSRIFLKSQWVMLVACLGALAGPARLQAQSTSMMGDWVEPAGSVLHVGPCGSAVCLWIVSLSNEAKAKTDIYNPDASLRSRALCGLKIGSGFILRDATHATDGTLYDPKTGNTYRGMMTAEGAMLDLRGYVSMPLFGRSQKWTRPATSVKACAAASGH